MLKGFGQFFIGADGGYDEMAAACIGGVLTFLGISIYVYCFKGQAFDPQAFGIGLGSTIGGAAIGMGAKAKMERKDG